MSLIPRRRETEPAEVPPAKVMEEVKVVNVVIRFPHALLDDNIYPARGDYATVTGEGESRIMTLRADGVDSTVQLRYAYYWSVTERTVLTETKAPGLKEIPTR